jgi:hypothetical protein
MTLDVHSIPLVGFFLLGVSCSFICAWLFQIMIIEVNAKSEGEKIGFLGATPATFLRIHHMHQRLYPHSRVRLTMKLFGALGLISGLIAAKLFGAW